MEAPINQLKLYLQTLETNEPINLERGDVEQADLESKSAKETKDALAILELIHKINQRCSS